MVGRDHLSVEKVCPYIAHSDVIGLCKGFAVTSEGLADTDCGALHRATSEGVFVLRLLERRIAFLQLLRYCRRRNISKIQVLSLLGFCNTYGALSRSRSLSEHVRAVTYLIHRLLFGIRFPLLVWRRKASVRAVSIAALRACLPLVVAACGLDMIIVLSTLPIESYHIMRDSGIGVSIVIGSIIAHEYGHIHGARSFCVPVVMQRGARLGILRQARRPLQELRSTLLGPVCGVLYCLLLAGGMHLLHLELLRTICLFAALLHSASLLPFYGDGQCIINLIKNRNKKFHETTLT